MFGATAPRARAAPDEASISEARGARDAAAPTPRTIRAATRCRWRSARALRKAGQHRRGDAGVRAGGRARADRRRRGQPARADGRDRAREEGSPARHHGADRRSSPSTSTTSRRRGSSPACCGRPASPTPAKLRPVYERIAAIDPVRCRRAHAMLGRMAHGARRRRRPRRAEFRVVLALEAGRPGGGAHRSRRELLQGRQDAPRRRSRRSPRSRSRRPTSARRSCCCSWWGTP